MTSRKTRVKKKQPPPAVKWCFTINNPDDVNLPLQFTDVKYLIWQLEFGKGTESQPNGSSKLAPLKPLA